MAASNSIHSPALGPAGSRHLLCRSLRMRSFSCWIWSPLAAVFPSISSLPPLHPKIFSTIIFTIFHGVVRLVAWPFGAKNDFYIIKLSKIFFIIP
jgi:hypothetical protein